LPQRCAAKFFKLTLEEAMEKEQVLSRLAQLKKEFEAGQGRLRELETEQSYLRETLLRISGAIQVLEELLGQAKRGNGTNAESQQRLDEAAASGGRG